MAKWSEFDLTAKIWTRPPAHMKTKVEHRVPLSDPVVSLLKSLPRSQGTDLVFPSRQNKPLSDMTISALMKRMHAEQVELDGVGWFDPHQGRPAVPHGLRSTFRDWVGEKTNYPSELGEFALAHRVGDDVERAYRRSDLLDRRRTMMEDWAKFVAA